MIYLMTGKLTGDANKSKTERQKHKGAQGKTLLGTRNKETKTRGTHGLRGEQVNQVLGCDT